MQVSAPTATITATTAREQPRPAAVPRSGPPAFELRDVTCRYGRFTAIRDISFDIPRHLITALIGPSGCGKSTLLRCLNRMNDLIGNATVQGSIRYDGEDIYAPDIDPAEVRRRIGMVFQKPNPFPKSVYDNVAFGPRLNGYRGNLDDLVEWALTRAALWDEVRTKLRASGHELSGGQQQRLCIARTLAVQPDVILMDEPCSALDPIATTKIEELMHDLRDDYTIVIVTHNMQQAARVSDMVAFLSVDVDMDDETGGRAGELVEFDTTQRIFTAAAQRRTNDYISGRFG